MQQLFQSINFAGKKELKAASWSSNHPQKKSIRMAQLQFEQRYIVSLLLKRGNGINEIARTLGRSPSVISREVKRNSSPITRQYNPLPAQQRATIRKVNRPYFRRLTADVISLIEEKLSEDYSPEQIVGYADSHGIDCVSVTTIYKYIRQDKANTESGKQLYKHLRCHSRKYVKKGTPKTGQGQIPNRRMIDQRPAEVEEKTRFGDFEADTMWISGGACLVTINDRTSSLSLIRSLRSKKAEEVERAIIDMLSPLKGKIKTITVDNGKEFSNHERIATALDTEVYFAHPYRSWERGDNQNTNRLYRQYFNNKTKLEDISDEFILMIQNRLNNRPRKRLGFMTPNHFLFTKFGIAVAFTS